MLYIFKDDTNRIVSVPEKPRRIVSLCPSITETLCSLGLGQRIAGRTRYCIHPIEEIREMRVVGGTKDIDLEVLRDIRPDIVIAVKEENNKSDIEEIRKFATVFVFDIRSFGDALMMMLKLGRMLNMRQRAVDLVNEIEMAYSHLPAIRKSMSFIYLVWHEPWILAATDTYIDSVLSCSGLKNAFDHKNGHYPQVSTEDLQHSKAELIILPSEPFPFTEVHRAELQNILPDARIVFADGEMMSWFGSRMAIAAGYLTSWLADI